MDQELRYMDPVLELGDEDRLFLYSKKYNKDLAVQLSVLLAKLQAPDSPAKYIFKPVESLVLLAGLDTTNPTLFPDNWVIHVKGKGLYALDRASVEEPNGNTVIAANGIGRWIGKGESAQQTSDYVSKSLGGTFEKSIAVNGIVTAQNFAQGSDERWKENIAPLREAMDPLALLQRMQFTKYNWKDNGEVGYGLIAQQLRELQPEMVYEKEDRLYVDLYAIVSVLGAALQQLNEKVNTLKAQ